VTREIGHKPVHERKNYAKLVGKGSDHLGRDALTVALDSREQQLLALQQKSAEKIKVVPSQGLGGTAYDMTFSDATITSRAASPRQARIHGAIVDSDLSKSKLANLVKLAEEL
jgi:hypothetical protein